MFDSSLKLEPNKAVAAVNATYGLAVLQLAHLDNDRQLYHQAVERLLTALEKEPKNPDTHYNLACAYALLRQTEAAVRHLRLCLELDSKQNFRLRASHDPDLVLLRDNPKYAKLFE